MWNVCVREARVSGVGRRECLSKYALTTGGQKRDGVSTCQSTKKQLCKIRRPCRAVEKTGPSTLTKECQICHQRTTDSGCAACDLRRVACGMRRAATILGAVCGAVCIGILGRGVEFFRVPSVA